MKTRPAVLVSGFWFASSGFWFVCPDLTFQPQGCNTQESLSDMAAMDAQIRAIVLRESSHEHAR